MRVQPKKTRLDAQPHHTTVELASSKLRLRDDLTFHRQEYGGAPCYLMEDELESKFYRIGLAEYHFISRLDGATTVSQAVAMSSADLGRDAVSEMESLTICKWLLDHRLATTEASRSSGRLLESYGENNRRKNLAKLNPVSFKFSLFNPDPLLSGLSGSLGWLFSKPMFIVWLIVVVMGAYHALANCSSLANSQNLIFAEHNWIWLGLTWLAMKVIHEFAHGMACKRYDGEVRQAGVVLIVMIPLPFVDVTSSWRFRSKWQRINVAAAGMYAELFLAAVAAIVWSYADVGTVRQIAFNVMLTGSVATVFFNANPLMRFDGYYILSDWLELPNLGTHGQQFMHWVGNRFYLGLDAKRPSWPEGRGLLIGIYAVAALIWKVLICIGLAIAAESLFFGAGFVLSGLAIGLWVLWPLAKLLKFVLVGDETRQPPGRIRFCVVTAGCGCLFWSAFCYLPWHVNVSVPAIVDFSDRTEIRVPLGGFVRKVLIESDQRVEAGQLLAVMENMELQADVENLQIELEENQLQLRQHRNKQQLAAFDVALRNRQALQQRLEERQQQVAGLEIRAPKSGVVIADDLSVLVGTYLSAGHSFCTIGTGEGTEIQALVSQKDLNQFEGRHGDPVHVRIRGMGDRGVPAILTRLNPRASVELPNPAFSAMYGGPLPVKYRSRSGEQESTEPVDDPFELIEPHFLARVRLADYHRHRLRAGQPAVVSIRGHGRSLGDVLYQNLIEWIRALRKQSQAIHHSGS